MITYLLFGAACTALGLAAGALLAMIYCAAAINHHQERMQRKVREAWDEARHYRQRLADCRQRSAGPWPPVPRGQQDRWETW